jgi:hypothetical protein
MPHDAYWVESRCSVIVSYGNPTRHVGIVLANLKLGERFEQRRSGIGVIDCPAAPDPSRGKCLQVKASDNSKIVLSAFERGK